MVNVEQLNRTTQIMKAINSKQFTNGFVSVIQLDDGKLIETTSTCLPMATEIRVTGKKDNKISANDFSMMNWKEKWTVGISTQTGCPIRCRFCAVNKLTDKQGWRNLTVAEMVWQAPRRRCSRKDEPEKLQFR